MRWVRFALFVLLATAAAVSTARATVISVKVLGGDGKPVQYSGEIEIQVRGLTTGASATGELSEGVAVFDKTAAGKPLPADIYVITVTTTSKGVDAVYGEFHYEFTWVAQGTLYLGAKTKATVVFDRNRDRVPDDELRQLADRTKADAAMCGESGKGLYDSNKGQLEKAVKLKEAELKELKAATAQFAKAHNLAPGSEAEVRSRLEDAQAQPAGSAGAGQAPILGQYLEALQMIDSKEKDLNEARRWLQSVPPYRGGETQEAQPAPDPNAQHGMAPPGDCPEGGGYLAGGLNSLFDTDFQQACGPGKQGTRGKGGKKGGSERDHERRD